MLWHGSALGTPRTCSPCTAPLPALPAMHPPQTYPKAQICISHLRRFGPCSVIGATVWWWHYGTMGELWGKAFHMGTWGDF